MNVLIAPDKFKGSLTAAEVCDAVEEGILKKHPDAKVTKLPLADGGEGTFEILTSYSKGKSVTIKVKGPLWNEIESTYGISADGSTAFVEMAKASGLQLIEKEKRNPLATTTFGTGQLMLDAISRGVSTIVLGIGGSSTNDAGIGMAHALGYRFVSNKGNELIPIGKNLVDIAAIETSEVHPSLQHIRVIALCDVNNPLFGENGAAYIYGPQKGADEKSVELLDRGLRNFHAVALKNFGKSADFAGAGAGGGIAGGASIFFNLTITSGIQYIIETLGVRGKLAEADLVITGEGKIDRQTLAGKVVASVASLGLEMNKKVVAVCGICELRKNEMEKIGVSEVLSLTDPFTTPDEAVKNARSLLVARITQL